MLRMAISAGRGAAALPAWSAGLGAVDFVLVREKALAGGELVRACQVVRAAVKAYVVVAGGRVDVALAAGLDGVHLASGAGELPVAEMRRLWPAAWVSRSCHTLDEVRQARDEGASAVLFAPVFGKVADGREVVQGTGLAALAEACRLADSVPVFALGGVTVENAPSCSAAGAAGIAGIRLFRG